MCLGMSILPDHPVIPDRGRKVHVRAQNRLTPPERADKMPCSRRNALGGAQYNGGVAQLGERVNGIHEVRSEEHTSELQSRRDLVCRLLLEKKKHCRDFDGVIAVKSADGALWIQGAIV